MNLGDYQLVDWSNTLTQGWWLMGVFQVVDWNIHENTNFSMMKGVYQPADWILPQMSNFQLNLEDYQLIDWIQNQSVTETQRDIIKRNKDIFIKRKGKEDLIWYKS